jgi:hypothetical protein
VGLGLFSRPNSGALVLNPTLQIPAFERLGLGRSFFSARMVKGFSTEKGNVCRILSYLSCISAASDDFLRILLSRFYQFEIPSRWRFSPGRCLLRRQKFRAPFDDLRSVPFQVAFFQSLGLSRSEVARMVERFPDLLTYSVEGNFRPKVEYLVKEMGRPVDDIVSPCLVLNASDPGSKN